MRHLVHATVVLLLAVSTPVFAQATNPSSTPAPAAGLSGKTWQERVLAAEAAGLKEIWIPDRLRTASPNLSRNHLQPTGAARWLNAGEGRDGPEGYERKFIRPN